MKKILLVMVLISQFVITSYAWNGCFQNDPTCVGGAEKVASRIKTTYHNGIITRIKLEDHETNLCKTIGHIWFITTLHDGSVVELKVHAKPGFSRFFRGEQEIVIAGLYVGAKITYVDTYYKPNNHKQGWVGCLQIARVQ